MGCDASLSLDDVWTHLYSHNNKIQAFAVLNDGKIVWQTDNWTLVDAVNILLEGIAGTIDTIEIARIPYEVKQMTEDFLVASSEKTGYLLMARTRSNSWLIAWATADSIPELAIIDLRYAASKA